MADNSFNTYSNYNKKSAFSSVVFGAEKPVLEVELNELQQIIARYREFMTNILGHGINQMDINEEMSQLWDTDEEGYVHLVNCIITGANGILFFVEDEKVLPSSADDVIYFKVWEEDATYESKITEYGNVNGNQIANKIMDSRSPVETTRRKVLKHELLAGLEVPESTDTVTYIKVADITTDESGEYVLTFNNLGNVTNLAHGVNEAVMSSLDELSEKVDKIQAKIDSGVTSGFIEISYEDYMALSEEEKNNGYVYFIPDAIVVSDDNLELDVDADGNLVVRYDDGE